ncbi:hypothetical protein FE697_014475 [Mumia zhuanghuii]|uniref:DUF6350 family protein n=2 Tax=Mumia TaxID=1546255 RepID=A0ABW1QMT2_9ACTN|nr:MULTISPECIES: DUF6350 family protein [Mumia]KAA1422357.1 hypothetical protein FE697_014475 [Mumia zhuanghuii]
MTETLAPNPVGARGTSDGGTRPGWYAGAAGAVLAAAIGLLVCGGLAVVVWMSAGSGSAAGALRAGAIAWLTAHGSGVVVSGAVLNAIPLGLFALVTVLLHGSVARVATGFGVAPTVRQAVSAGAATAVLYAGVLAVVAWWSALGAVHVETWRAAVAGLVVGGLFGFTGGAHGSGLAQRQYDALPPLGRSALRGARVGAVALVGAAALLVVGGIVARIDTAGAMWDSLRPDALGGLGLFLVCLVVLPNLVLWNVAALLGPGYALGAGTSVTLTASSLGAVPALPVLAALPPTGPRPAWLVALSALPLLCGAIAGYRAVSPRRSSTVLAHDLRTAVVGGGGAGAIAGSLLAAAMLLSGGSVGPGRLGHSGPDLAVAAPLAIVVLAVGGAVGGAAAHYRGRRGADDDATAPAADPPDSTPDD